jgi:hypothetical protein
MACGREDIFIMQPVVYCDKCGLALYYGDSGMQREIFHPASPVCERSHVRYKCQTVKLERI